MDEYTAMAIALCVESMSTTVDLSQHLNVVLAHVPLVADEIVELVNDSTSKSELKHLRSRAQSELALRLGREADKEPF